VNIIIYIVAGAIGLYLSLLGVFFALIASPLFAFILGALLLAAHIASILYVRKKAMEGKGRLAALALVSPMNSAILTSSIIASSPAADRT